MSWNQNDISFKTLLNKRQTDASLAFYSEWGDNTINVHLKEIWINNIPIDPSYGPFSSFPYIDYFDKLTLKFDTFVNNGMVWAAVTNPSIAFDFTIPDDPTNPRLKDWISDKYGDGYDLKLFSNGIQIQKTSTVYPWRFDYMTGILTLNIVPPEPVQITGYRYNGVKGIIAPTDASGTLSQAFQLYMTNNGVKLKDASGNLEIRNSTDTDYRGARLKSLNIGSPQSLYLLNIKEEVIENLLSSYYVIDTSYGFGGTYSLISSDASGGIVNDTSTYSNPAGDKCIYKVGTTWFLQEIESSALILDQTQNWNGPFWYNTGSVAGAYFGNSNYYGQNLTILNYNDTYKRAVGIQGNVDILGCLGVHGSVIAEALKLDPSYNGVLIAINGEVGISKYPKSKSYNTTISYSGFNTFTIDHSLNTLNHLIAVYDPSTQEELFPDKIRGLNSSILNFTDFPIGQSYDVIIIGY
jgi:hypothetical protein